MQSIPDQKTIAPAGSDEESLEFIRSSLTQLTTAGNWLWVTFEGEQGQGVIEASFSDPRLVINIPHAEKSGLLGKLSSLGIEIPDFLRVLVDKRKGMLSMGYLELEAKIGVQMGVATFIYRLGRELHGWSATQELSATHHS